MVECTIIPYIFVQNYFDCKSYCVGIKKLVKDAVISKVLLIKTKTSSINKNKLNLTVFQSPTQTFTINVLTKQLEITSLYILELNFVFMHILLTHTLFYLHS